MPNVHDYIEWRGDIPLTAVAFSDIDNLVLSCISLINFDGIVGEDHQTRISMREAEEIFSSDSEKTSEDYGLIFPTKDFMKVFSDAAHSARFGDVLLSGYVNRVDHEGIEQFSAVTFSLPDGRAFVSFRGTDDNIVAWKEDCLLSYVYPIKAQKSAQSYLERVGEAFSGNILVGGHSKGGNLSVYACMNASDGIKNRIERVWSNDGPGFFRRVLAGEQYQSIKDRLTVVIPESSIIGRLFDNEPEDEIIVMTNTVGLLQHNPFSWQIKGGDFVRAEKFSDDSTVVRRAFRKYLSEIDGKGREEFVFALFSLLEMTEAKTFTALAKDGFSSMRGALKQMSGLTRSQRDMLLSFVTFLVNLPVK